MTACAYEVRASLEGFSVYPLLYWASCFKSLIPSSFLVEKLIVKKKYLKEENNKNNDFKFNDLKQLFKTGKIIVSRAQLIALPGDRVHSPRRRISIAIN